METTRPTVLVTDHHGSPLKLDVRVRQSESMPARMKVTFTVPCGTGLRVRKPDGELAEEIPVPAQAKHVALCDEFRLEMN